MLFPGFTQGRRAVNGIEINFATGGQGPALLLLHGYPQTHAIWHHVAPALAGKFTIVAADLRGYGDSSKPEGGGDHLPYAKRTMANDMAELMTALGHDTFMVAGHDRGGRVAHRLVRDHSARVHRWAVLDICPTLTTFERMDHALAHAYYHWLFLAQPADLPERFIGSDPDYYLDKKLANWSSGFAGFHPEALAEYRRCFRDSGTIHGSCEDYRAAATIDLVHDRADRAHVVQAPLLVLWGEKAVMHRSFDVLDTWRECVADVRGRPLPCGHYLPEEEPSMVVDEFSRFFGAA